jgi:hypothetical protein
MIRILLITLLLVGCTQAPDLDPGYATQAYCGYEPVKGGDAADIAAWGKANHVRCSP